MTRLSTILALLSVLAVPVRADDAADIDWAERQFAQAMDTVLPLPEDASGLFIRAYHDLHHSFPEFSVAISVDRTTGTLHATTLVADKLSIFKQLQALHRTRPAISPAEAFAELRVIRRTASERQCPAVARLNSQFTRLRLAPPELDLIVLHPVVYQLRVSGSGELSYDIHDPDPAVRAWASRALSLIASCHGTT